MSTPAQGPASPSGTALAEYKQIKTEQAGRIATRDNLLYVTLAGSGAIFAAAHGGTPAYLLAVPVLAFILGWTFVVNDAMISAIGTYFRSHPVLGPDLGWERDRPADARRRSRKWMQLARDLTAFPLLGYAALIAYWTSPGPSPLLLLASAIEAAALGVLAWQIVLYTETGRRGPAGDPS